MTEPDDRPTAPLTTVGPGRVLGDRYELGPPLGGGGMAVVFLARDRVLEREVAVKVLREQYATDQVFIARFTGEALHAARLSHPGLVPIFDAGVDRGTAFIVMEVVKGRTLRQTLTTDGPLPIDQCISIAADVCEVLDVAHRAGIVHRDIKPSNILISDDGRTRVFDFGIARGDGSEALTQTAMVVGTAAYISPEQAAGQPAGPQSDVYSVGCVLMEMLTGSPPFTADTPVALLYQHLNEAPPAPSTERPEASAALDAVVLHLLAKDPAQRPATASDSRRELLSVLSPISGDTLTLVPQTVTRQRPSRRLIGIAAITVVLLLAGVAFGVLISHYDPASSVAEPSTNGPTRSAGDSSRTPTPATTTPTTRGAAQLAVATATTVPGALAVLRHVMAAGQQSGLISRSAATQLGLATDEVATALSEAKGKSAIPRVRRLADLVDSLAGNGHIEANAAGPLHQAIEQLLQIAEALL